MWNLLIWDLHNSYFSLKQVCQKLGIIESDYFGLQFTTVRKEEIWLNLRNEIRQEIHAHPFRPTSTDGSKPAAIRFRLKVKFWVPPHLILQESTRQYSIFKIRIQCLFQLFEHFNWKVGISSICKPKLIWLKEGCQ